MSSSFYTNAIVMDTKNSPWSNDITYEWVDADGAFGTKNENGVWVTNGKKTPLRFFKGKSSQLFSPQSMMNENVAINYRTIYNGYPAQSESANSNVFTEYNDYLRCMSLDSQYRNFLKDKKNPTYQNILEYYSDGSFDPHGLSKYKIQDFIYLKYFNQIPNNYMITLRRYTQPCEDHMFGLDLTPESINNMHNRSTDYFALATAVTYMGEQTGNKLSDILKFDYGANWEDKTAQVTSLQSTDGGLAAQMTNKLGINSDITKGEASLGTIKSRSGIGSMLAMSAIGAAKGMSVNEMMAKQHEYQGNAFESTYGNEFYGDMNVIQNVKLRSRGLTFSNSFSLNFEYSLKSLKCVNPRIAMMDILSNFLILTGNYGQFWGGATIFYGAHNIAPQFGNPQLLREGKYGDYIKGLWEEVKEGVSNMSKADSEKGEDDGGGGILGALKNVLTGGIQSLIGNIFGGNIGQAGESQAPPALLSGEPSGYWHLTVGNPLDPIAMMGNMAVTKTTVQFGDVLGYDDFPTEIKFTVDMEHCRPRDNAAIETMFNGGKGRFYSFADPSVEHAMNTIDPLRNFKTDSSTQEVNLVSNNNSATKVDTVSNHTIKDNNRLKIIGGQLNN